MIYECKHCGYENESEEIDVAIGEGFWCEDCDTFNYFEYDRKERDCFLLILEEKSLGNTTCPKAPIRLNKRLSPLRYPGGKSKFIDYVYWKLQGRKMKVFIEPFAGGASVGLALLDAGLIECLYLNDSDFGIYSLFHQIIKNPIGLIEELERYDQQGLSREVYFGARKIIEKDYKDCDELTAATACLIVNRLAYSGICKANPLGGKNGTNKELLARWNLQDLIRRIRRIHSLGGRIKVMNKDALKVIEDMYYHADATQFIDPPYYKKGEQLYNHFFTEEDHMKLRDFLVTAYHSMPGADLIITYDNDPFIEDLYSNYIFIDPDVEKVSRIYSA